jgi:hypothetical protein
MTTIGATKAAPELIGIPSQSAWQCASGSAKTHRFRKAAIPMNRTMTRAQLMRKM